MTAVLLMTLTWIGGTFVGVCFLVGVVTIINKLMDD